MAAADPWTEPIDGWITWQQAAGRPTSTLKLRRSQLRRLAAAFPAGPWAVELEVLAGWLAGRGWDSQTLRSHRAAIRGFYAWASATGRTDRNPAAALPSVPGRTGRPRPAPDETVTAALSRADTRDGLMIRLAAEAGLRAGEIARVHQRDLTQDPDGWNLIVRGKGDRTRAVPLTPGLAATLRDAGTGWLFPGRIDGHLSPAYVSKRLSAALGPEATGHQLRHRFASRAYAAERDLRAVQELLGHTSVATTQIYTAVPAGAKRRAVLAVA